MVCGEFLINLVKHGEPKTGKFHAGYSAIAVASEIWLLYMGGFFKWIH